MAREPREAIVLRDEKRNQRFMFPVNPARISVHDGREFSEVPIIGLGTALLAGSVNPQEITFESFFPRNYDPSFCNYPNLQVPEDTVAQLMFWLGRSSNNIQLAATPLRVMITGTQFSQLMVITEFSHEFVGGSPDAIYFNITMRQWRRQRVRVEEVGDGSSGSDSDERPESPSTGDHHTVVKGDTLWSLAKRFYGSGSKWSTIYAANESVIGSNPNLIQPGMVLAIP